MSRSTDSTAWRDLEDEARADAASKLPTPDGWHRITQAIDAARAELDGEDVRSHRIGFDPEQWQPYASTLPERVWRAKRITRGDVFGVAAEPTSAKGDWRLFCSTYIWGQGSNGYGKSRLERITQTTPPDQLAAIIASARARLAAYGPVSAYTYLRGTASACTVPYRGPAFFTKLLYFVDIPSAPGRALILDNLTAGVVADISGLPYLVDERGRSVRWTGYRYGVYLAWMTQVAGKLHVLPDFLEYALFADGRRRKQQKQAS